jgi:hypothetical protein
LELWQQLGGDRPEMALFLQMLAIGIQYKKNPQDDRVFFNIQREIRPLLMEAIGISIFKDTSEEQEGRSSPLPLESIDAITFFCKTDATDLYYRSHREVRSDSRYQCRTHGSGNR